MSVHKSFHRENYVKKKRNLRFLKECIALLVLFIFFVALALISRIDKIRISDIKFSGGLLVSKEEVTKETTQFLSGNYVWFFPKNNIVLYPRKALENFLKERFKRIDNISISLTNFNILNINISERGLFALWCGTAPNETLVEKCYFMDNNGIIFSEAPSFSGDAYFKYYGSITDLDPVGSTYLASTTEFEGISGFVEHLKDNTKIHPVYLIAKEKDQFEIVLSSGGRIYIDDSKPLSKTSDNLDALIDSIYSSSTVDTSQIDYIDLRFGNKLFYKLK